MIQHAPIHLRNPFRPRGDRRDRDDRRRADRRWLLALVAVLGIAGAGGSLALFTDQDELGANAFATGTLVLTTTPTTTAVTLSNMAPGDSVTGSLVVANAGSLDLRYALSTATTNADGKGLADQLTATVRTIGSGCSTFDGTQLYAGSLAGITIGDPATGADAGDRTLLVSASETLCIRVALPLSTGNAYQAAATTATFTFDAEQTKNN